MEGLAFSHVIVVTVKILEHRYRQNSLSCDASIHILISLKLSAHETARIEVCLFSLGIRN